MSRQIKILGLITILLSVISVGAAQNQATSFGGLGSASATPTAAYQSLGTVPVFSGQTQLSTGGSFRGSIRPHGPFVHPHRFPRRSGFRFFLGSGLLATSGFFGLFDYGYPYEYEAAPYGYEDQMPQSGQELPQGRRYLTYSVNTSSEIEGGKPAPSIPVSFKSTPAGADILMDGYLLGHTPAILRLPFGMHLISIQKWGFDAWQRDVNVKGNEPLLIYAKLANTW